MRLDKTMITTQRPPLTLAFVTIMAVTGCSSGESDTTPIAATDAGQDSSLQEASTDSSPDVRLDQGADTNPNDTSADQDIADTAPESSLSDGGEADAMMQKSFGIMSLNLHCMKVDGTTFANNEARFAAVADAVNKEDVHAIAVQEACEQKGVIAMDLLAAALKTATGDTWSTAWTATHIAWQGTADEAMEGVGILIRGSLSDKLILDYKVQGPQFRKSIGAKLPPELGGSYLFSVHLDYSSAAARAAQGRETASALVTMTDPSLDLLVAGDFNAKPAESPPQNMLAYGFTDLTAKLDSTRIDHIFAHRGAALGLVAAKTVFDGTTYPVVSDHHGVIARVQLRTAIEVPRTRLRVKADASQWIAVRGSLAPLNWTEGYPAVLDANGWKLVLTEYAKGQSFDWKALRQDTLWETSDNHSTKGGDTTEVTPTF